MINSKNFYTMSKKIFFSFLLIGMISIHSNVIAQTTIEEYNYVTKGYKVQEESGLDMKKGYLLEMITNEYKQERIAELRVLYRLKDTNKKEVAAYMLIYKRSGSNNVEYICVPHPSSDEIISEMYWKQLYSGDGDSSYKLQLISYVLSKGLKW